MKLKLASAAVQDLLDIDAAGQSRFGALQAVRYRESITRFMDLIAFAPRIGVQVSAKRPNVRMAVHRPHVILYGVSQDAILVLRVVDGRRDWKSLMGAK